MKKLIFFSSNLQESLGQTFDMEKPAVHAIVAKMIISEELMASMDEPSECMIMHRTEPSRLQSLSLQLSDKLAQLVENNERLLELRPGGMIFRFHFYTKQYKLNKLYKYKLGKWLIFIVFLYANNLPCQNWPYWKVIDFYDEGYKNSEYIFIRILWKENGPKLSIDLLPRTKLGYFKWVMTSVRVCLLWLFVLIFAQPA